MKQRIFLIALTLGTAALALAVWLFILNVGGSQRFRAVDAAVALTNGGDPRAGFEIISRVGCGACHVIPGIPGAYGKIGPSLESFKDRTMIAGVLANSPANLQRWLRDPRAVDPKTAMPDLELTEEQARDASAYLYAPVGP